jgi:hypothetical protein
MGETIPDALTKNMVMMKIETITRSGWTRADHRRTDEYLTEASRPKDNGEVDARDEVKDS